MSFFSFSRNEHQINADISEYDSIAKMKLQNVVGHCFLEHVNIILNETSEPAPVIQDLPMCDSQLRSRQIPLLLNDDMQ